MLTSEYMTYESGRLLVVRCKGCPAVIVERQGKLMVPTSAYAELVIAMREPNGVLSKHETGMCRVCRDRIVNDGPRVGELEALYAQDVEQMIACALRAGNSESDVLKRAERMAVRAPLRALNERGRGEGA
jgi:hypothetical protein